MRKSALLLASVALAVLLACGLTLTVRTEPARAAFPGTNGKILFAEVDHVEEDYGIKRINPNGSGLSTLVAHPVVLDSQPAFSQNGTRVAYAGREVGQREWQVEIYKINVSTRAITQITNNQQYDSDPTWSPDGTRIAFEHERSLEGGGTDTEIYAKSSKGTGETLNLTKTPNTDEFAPAWSPDGNEIAFDTRGEIFVLNLESGQRRNLTNDRTENYDTLPSWSPDGTRLVFESSSHVEEYGYRDRIYTMDASDGSDRRLLAQALSEFGAGVTFSGTTYSPDGKKIAYLQTAFVSDDANPRLYKMNASDGSNKQLIYKAVKGEPGDPYGDAALRSPDWGVQVPR
jgi:Tol biopolymer transport system component